MGQTDANFADWNFKVSHAHIRSLNPILVFVQYVTINRLNWLQLVPEWMEGSRSSITCPVYVIGAEYGVMQGWEEKVNPVIKSCL